MSYRYEHTINNQLIYNSNTIWSTAKQHTTILIKKYKSIALNLKWTKV